MFWRGGILELHKDVAPWNADRRCRVNAASASLWLRLNELDARRAETGPLRDAYHDVIERCCGHRDPANCQLAPGPYAEAIAAYDRQQMAYDREVAAYDQYISALNDWDCWSDYAWSSRASSPPSCLLVPVRPHPGVVKFGAGAGADSSWFDSLGLW